MNYQKYADKAFDKIKQYGSPIIVKRSGKKVYDKATNEYVDTGAEFIGYALQRNFNQQNIDGTNIRFGDIMLMCVLEEEPKSNDTVLFAEKTYTILSVEPFNPDGKTAIFYEVQAR